MLPHPRALMPRPLLSLLFLVALTGCTHWVKEESVLAAPVPDARKQFQIFTPTDIIRAHSLRSDSTSLSYVPYVMSPMCDSCRVTIPRTSVDSVRTGKLSASRNIVLVAALIALGYALSGLSDDSAVYGGSLSGPY